MAVATLFAILSFSSISAQATVTTGSMNVPRMLHQANALPDGRILFSGGYAKPGTAAYASAEIYDPATGLFTLIAPMQQARTNHGAVTLADGRVLVIGGTIATSPALVGTATAELYDPATGQWTYTGNLSSARSRVLARLLPDGKVFVMNEDGYDSNKYYGEVYDPATGTFTRTGNVLEASGWHGLVVLADGRVMKLGGYANSNYSRRAEIWDPATNQWNATGSMLEARQDVKPALLPDGKVLVAGGSNVMVALNTSEIYDPATGLFTAAGVMPDAFKADSSTILADGSIVFTGPYTKNLVRFQPGTGTWNLTGPKRGTVRLSSVSRLQDGNMLLAGGAALNDATTYAWVWDQACAPQKISLPVSSQTVQGDGGLVSWDVTAAPGCRFDTADLPAWLTPDSSAPLQMAPEGTMRVSFRAAANATGAARTASFMLGNNTATVTQAASPSCPTAPIISPASFNFTSSATNGTMGVSAGAGCPWSISALPSWVTATSKTSGTGNGSVSYAVAANTGVARSGNGQLDALGFSKTFVMSQDAPPLCPTAPSLSPGFLSLTSAASSGTISVSAPANCPWRIGTVPSWVTIPAGTSGTGNGSFMYTVAANSGAARSGSGSVTGPGVASTFNVSQAAGACASWSITPQSNSFAAGATTGSLTVTAPGSCNWSLSALPGWMALTSNASGAGNGSIGYTVTANTGAARSATATLSGAGPTLSLNLMQAAPVSTTCTMPISSGIPINGQLQAKGCPAGARGASYYTDRYTFTGTPGQQVTIFVSSTNFDTYVYLRNPAGSVITSNDDGGGGSNSRIPATSGSYTLPAGSGGVYTIEVSSYGANAGGAYTVSLTQ